VLTANLYRRSSVHAKKTLYNKQGAVYSFCALKIGEKLSDLSKIFCSNPKIEMIIKDFFVRIGHLEQILKRNFRTGK
jgi:hypothetical protein